MRKLFIAATILGSLISSMASAQTEGSYLGVDVIRTEAEFESVNVNNVTLGNNLYGIQDEDQISFGVNYKYAFNFDGFFIAPGVFYEHTNISMKDNDQDEWNLNHRIGAKVDFGYDIVDEFAVLANVGFANNYYEVDWKSVNRSNKDSDLALTYGVGLKFTPAEAVSFNVGYDVSTVEMDTPNQNVSSEFDVHVAKVGVAFNF